MSSFVPLGDLPAYVRDNVCRILDSSTQHNWVKLLQTIPDQATYRDLLELRSLSDRHLSPSSVLLQNLGGQGWDVEALGRAAVKAGIGSVVDILTEFCQDEGIDANFQDPPAGGDRFAAKSCLSRSRYPSDILPPSGGLEEAKRRYNFPDSPAPPPYSEVRGHSGLPGPGSGEKVVRETLRKASPTTNAAHTQTTPTSQLHPTVPATPPQAELVREEPHNGIIGSSSEAPPTGSTMGSSHSTRSSAAVSKDSNSSSTAPTSNATPLSSSTPSADAMPPDMSLPPPPAHLEEVKYDLLAGATGNFDRTPYKDGGHKVGEGGFGEVFQCWLTLRSGRVHAAVKILLNKDNSTPGDSLDRRQFSTEIQALSRLSHPCLLPVLGYSRDGPHLCLIYPFMSNGSLEAHLGDHTSLPPRKRLAVATDIAEGLDYLHFKAVNTIIHRDVKSANVLLTEAWRGKLGDFGMARLFSQQQQQGNTSVIHTTTIVGTRVYMAPETTHGKISRRADVYSLGVVLFELLTGKCALTNIPDSTGEETDLVTYVEDLEEGEDEILNVAGWEPEVWEKMWSLAKQCLLRMTKRPSSTKLLEDLQKLQKS